MTARRLGEAVSAAVSRSVVSWSVGSGVSASTGVSFVLALREPWRPGGAATAGRGWRVRGAGYLATTAAASFDSGSPRAFTAVAKTLRSGSPTLSYEV
ncbi:hypothetical protein KNE206_69230 [Kitasatospora sp. NE20-6]